MNIVNVSTNIKSIGLSYAIIHKFIFDSFVNSDWLVRIFFIWSYKLKTFLEFYLYYYIDIFLRTKPI